MGSASSRQLAAGSRADLASLPSIPFDKFLELLAGSGVARVIFRPNDVLEVALVGAERVTTSPIRGLSTEWLIQRLLEAKASFIEGRSQPSSVARSIRAVLVLAVPLVYLAIIYHMMKKLTEDPGPKFSPSSKGPKPQASTSPVTWDSVAGMDDARREVMEVVDFMRQPERYHRLGARCPRGLLLSGAPGCGKTLLARAAACEANMSFIVCSASDFVEVFVGRGAARVRELFRRAERCAPCILFFDELDALAKARVGGIGGNDEREQTLNQLLAEMDGFEEDNLGSGQGPVVVIAATNRPDVLDPALLRPGRFDRHVRVGLPNAAGRFAILQVHVSKRNVPLEDANALRAVAEGAKNFSGAELANVINEAALLAVRDNSAEVRDGHLHLALEKVRSARGGQFSSMLTG